MKAAQNRFHRTFMVNQDDQVETGLRKTGQR
jgi:hypothetical protein